MMQSKCLECQKVFPSERSLHTHIKAHSLSLSDYYLKHYPRKNLLTGTLLPFKDKQSYFQNDFANREQLISWCNIEKAEIVKPYILELLKRRVKEKELKFGPTHIDLETSIMPSIDIYKKHFSSYTGACAGAGVKPLLSKNISSNFFNDFSDIEILIDTREQQPLSFKKQRGFKLDFGDYTCGGTNYNKTFVDRKSEGDFKSTLVGENLERFRKELKRATDLNCFLYIVVESSVEKIEATNPFGPHRSNLKFIYHNMRLLEHEFAGSCQFVFSGGRRASSVLIPKLLVLGPKLWETDVQYFIDKDNSWLGSKETKKENLHFVT